MKSARFWSAFLGTLMLFVDANTNDANAADTTHKVHGTPMHLLGLHPPFIGSDLKDENWDFGGNTVVRVYEYVRLTNDATSQIGWLWSKHPLHMPAWSVEFDFRIHGQNSGMFGDGLAFWYTPDQYTRGDVFGFKDQFKGLGVFFDTFANGHHDHSFPYISAMIGDGNTFYDHANDNKGTLAGHGCEANIRGSEKPLTARVTYFKNKVLELEFTDNGQKGWQSCFVVSNVTLPDTGYIGFSSLTGDAHDNHEIHRVSSYVHLDDEEYHGTDAVDSKIHDDSAHGHHSSETSGGFWHGLYSVLRMSAFGGILVAVIFAYRAYSKRNMKRF